MDFPHGSGMHATTAGGRGTSRTCTGCTWWDASTVDLGLCRHSPPVVVEANGHVNTYWPETRAEERCSKWVIR